jgi:hypothetical protein
MTWQQTINIQEGHHKFIKEEHERHILENRVLCMYIGNMMGKNPEPFAKIYPISSDNQTSQNQTKNVLSIEQFYKVLTATLKANE